MCEHAHIYTHLHLVHLHASSEPVQWLQEPQHQASAQMFDI